MRQLVVRLAPLALLGGCSLLYNPSNLPPSTDADIDAPPVDPTMLELDRVTPTVISEGMGAPGSRAAVLVVHGKNMSRQGMTVTIAAAGGAVPEGFTVELDKLDVARDGDLLAIPVRMGVVPALTAGMSILLDVTVTQESAAGPVARTIQGAFSLRGLDELIHSTGDLTLPAGISEYSLIDISGGNVSAPNSPDPVVLRSMSSVNITRAVSVSAGGTNPGPGGGRGGTGGGALGSPGGPGVGPFAGQTSGAAAGFNPNDLGLSTLDSPNRGSGGAGGDGAALGAGGNGGGGGGSIEITARADLRAAAVRARGAAGTAGGGGAPAGGGGSGGVILLRAGGTLIATEIDVRSGGTGANGRARYDAGGTVTLPSGDLGTNHFRGLMFKDPPEITKSSKPQLTVTGKAFLSFGYFFTQGSSTKGPFTATTGDENGVVELPEGLFRGANQVCLVVDDKNPSSATRNCIDLVFVP